MCQCWADCILCGTEDCCRDNFKQFKLAYGYRPRDLERGFIGDQIKAGFRIEQSIWRLKPINRCGCRLLAAPPVLQHYHLTAGVSCGAVTRIQLSTESTTSSKT
eukprot:COSAG01_NODE_12765_length_1689_cov_1.267296_3_plen_104_part_00